MCDRYDWRDSGRLRRFFSQSPGSLVGSARPAPAACCVEAETPATGPEPTRSALLDPAAECMAAMVRCSRHRGTGDRNRVASKRLPTILALASRRRSGRPRITDEVRSLIRQMGLENAGWGAPKIHGELLKLGFAVSERTVTRYLRGLRPRTGRSDQRWKAFLANHREAIVAFDLFTVPTLTFNLLYCFVIIEHGRRKILHCNVTAHPTSEWVVQQLREAFAEAAPYRYAIFDHDSKFNVDVVRLLAATGLEPKRTSIQAPWQNGIAELGSAVVVERCWTASSP